VTAVDDLAAWLTAVWDEQEAAAKAAFSNQEDPEHGWGQQGRAVTPHVGVIHEDVQRDHVVAWHPGVVLARIAADRKILALHAPEKETPKGGGKPYVICGTCWGEPICQTIRLLAQPYADRPGYQESWAVQ
jgi:hypothetical protein